MFQIHRGKVILLLTLFLILALSHPFFQSNPIVQVKVVKRDNIPTVTVQSTITQSSLTQSVIGEKQETTLVSSEPNYYLVEERSNSFSTYKWSALPLLSFFGFTIILHQILEDV